MELISKDDGGEEVEQMPEIDLSSDSEGEVQCIDPPTFYDSVGLWRRTPSSRGCLRRVSSRLDFHLSSWSLVRGYLTWPPDNWSTD